MRVKIRCDSCGKIGTGDEIGTDYEGRDMCARCRHADKVKELEAEFAKRNSLHAEWLEEMNKRIAEMRGKL